VKKTNAARILDGLSIRYELRHYTVDEDDLSAPTVAAKVGLPPGQVFKTLVVKGDKRGVMVVCLPGNGELDLKRLAAVSGNKRVEMVPLKDVQPLTGYIRGGVSPLGTKKAYPTVVDASALQFEQIAVSAGIRGCQMVLSPEDLLKAVGTATVDGITQSCEGTTD